MKKPLVDYREFRFSRINDPRFRHLWLLLGWLGYFILYFLTEQLIPAEKCRPVHCAVDELIPFCEYFVIPYVLWYGLIVFSLGYFLLYNIEAFKKKITPDDKIDLVQGNALDLSLYADKSFDIVLLFGPLYHLKNDANK